MAEKKIIKGHSFAETLKQEAEKRASFDLVIAEKMGALAVVENAIAQIKEQEKIAEQLKVEIQQAMEDYSITKWELANGTKIAYIGATTTERLDTKALKENEPELCKLYTVESEKKAYIKITPAKKGDI